MKNYILGFVTGVVVSAVGFTGLAAVADQGITKLKSSLQILVEKESNEHQ